MLKKEAENQPQSFNLQDELFLINDINTSIKAHENNISEEKVYIDNLQKQKSDKLKIIQDKIKKGEITTGDKIRDFCLVWHDGNAKTEIEYKRLWIDLEKHQGQFFLFKEIQVEEHDWIDPLKEENHHDYTWNRHFSLSNIGKNDLKFDIQHGKISMGSKTAFFKVRTGAIDIYDPGMGKASSMVAKIDEYKDDISIYRGEFENLNKPFEGEMVGIDNLIKFKSPKYEIIIGDNEVYKYLWHDQKIDCIILPVIAEALGKDGNKIWPPALEITLSSLRQCIFKNIYDAYTKIKFTESPMKKGNKLDKMMRNSLKEALQLGMHKTPWVYKKEADKKGGEKEINVPEFIKTLSELFSINIPEFPCGANL